MPEKCLFIYVGQTDMSYTLAGQRDYEVKREPQIGFAYLGAILREQNVDTEILDFTIKPYSTESLIKYMERELPVFVGFYAAAAIKSNVIDYINALRKHFSNLKILVGGPDLYEAEGYLLAGADAYCLGEGEKTIVDLLAFSRGKTNLPAISGIAYLKDKELAITSPRELISNLDELPIPAWDKFNLNYYHDFHVFDMRHPYTSIMASRGCPFRCTYCIAHKIWQGKYRRRSVKHVLKEVDYLVQERGIKYLNFQDDIWSWQDDQWAKDFCREIIRRNYDLKWRCVLHPFSFLKSRGEIIPLMRQAGCTSVTTGLQSASIQILKNINRSPFEPEALADLIKIMKKSGILCSTAFIFGLPGDTEQTIEESIHYALKIRPTFCGFYVLSVLPGSDIWLKQKKGEFYPLPENYVKKKCKAAARRFYTNPLVMFNMLISIIKKNPKWLLRALGHIKYLFEISGIFKTKFRSEIF